MFLDCRAAPRDATPPLAGVESCPRPLLPSGPRHNSVQALGEAGQASRSVAYAVMAAHNAASPPEFLTTTLHLEHQRHLPVSIVPKDESTQIATPLSPDTTRPYVTLTFAQSLDAKIAGKGGQQLALSGKESLIMTHWSALFTRLSSRDGFHNDFALED